MNLSRKKLAGLLCLVVLVSSLVSYQVFVWGTGAKPSPDLALDDFPSSISFKVDNDASTSFWATKYNGSIVYYSADGADIVQACLNDSSAAGGCVYVMPGTFSGSVVMKNETRLILESGVTGLGFTVEAGAYCDIADWNVAHVYHYVAGVISFDEDLNAGTIAQLTWANSTSFNCTNLYASFVNCAVINNTNGYVQAYRLLVENGTSFPTVVSDAYLFLRSDLNALYFYNGTDWTACGTGSGADLSLYLLSASATNFLFQNGTRALTADWNTGSYGIYGASWVNATSLGFTDLYKDGVLVGFVEPATFVIDVSGSTYRAWFGSNGTLFTSSTIALATINNVFGNVTASPPQKTVVLKGNFTLTGAMTLGSYTYVDATQAVFILGPGVSSDIVRVASGATMSEWHGGLIIGNWS